MKSGYKYLQIPKVSTAKATVKKKTSRLRMYEKHTHTDQKITEILHSFSHIFYHFQGWHVDAYLKKKRKRSHFAELMEFHKSFRLKKENFHDPKPMSFIAYHDCIFACCIQYIPHFKEFLGVFQQQTKGTGTRFQGDFNFQEI